MVSSKVKGDFGENIALIYLKKLGYKKLFCNFRSKFGEIDIIAKDGENLVFVEVKTRNNLNYGYPEEAVNKAKLNNIKKTIDYFLFQYAKYNKCKTRIDVVSILYLNGKQTIKYLKNVE